MSLKKLNILVASSIPIKKYDHIIVWRMSNTETLVGMQVQCCPTNQSWHKKVWKSWDTWPGVRIFPILSFLYHIYSCAVPGLSWLAPHRAETALSPPETAARSKDLMWELSYFMEYIQTGILKFWLPENSYRLHAFVVAIINATEE